MKAIEFHPDAQEEADDAAEHYEGERAGLGREFREELEAALERLATNPLMCAVEVGRYRACPLHRFPYTLFYLDLPDRVWVAAVAHQRRRPGYWRRRRP